MTVITNKFRAKVGIRDSITVEKPIEYIVHYLMDYTGVPTNVGLPDECCLNIVDSKLFQYDNVSSSWIEKNINVENCFLFSDVGHYNSGNGHNLPDMMIYQKELDGSFSKRYAHDGVFVLIKNKSRNHTKNCLRVYQKSINEWTEPDVGSSSGVTDEAVQDIVANLLQEGEAIDLNYNDSLNMLTISCELAESGDSSVNKGVANFSNESFAVNTGFVSIYKIDGGNFV